jgi:hypothetical protein
MIIIYDIDPREKRIQSEIMLYFQTHCEAREMRISFEKRYFSLNRIILLVVGLWPYQQSKVVRFQSTLFLSILISFIIFQVQ